MQQKVIIKKNLLIKFLKSKKLHLRNFLENIIKSKSLLLRSKAIEDIVQTVFTYDSVYKFSLKKQAGGVRHELFLYFVNLANDNLII